MPHRTTLVTLTALAGLVLVAGAVWMFLPTGGDDGRGDGERLALGAQLYDAHCAACHGADLEGEANWRQRRPDGTLPAPPHDASGHTWHHPDQQLFAITKFGTAALVGPDYQSAMLGFGDVLSDAEIWAVLDFIRAQWPDDIRRRQAEITARAGGRE